MPDKAIKRNESNRTPIFVNAAVPEKNKNLIIWIGKD
jgi:hypothetical protein